jgi:hypothetical protein
VITGVTDIAHITTKQDMSRWTRAHADVAGITWSVFAGPGGTMIIVEHAEDRCSANRANPSPEASGGPAGSTFDPADAFPVSALQPSNGTIPGAVSTGNDFH